MTLSGSAPPPIAASDLFKTLWSLPTSAPTSGVTLARESGQILVWDENHWLYLLNGRGERQAQARPLAALAAACCADDGSALAVAGNGGEVVRLAPDLSSRWQRSVPHPAVAAALDPFGLRLAVSDIKGGLFIFDPTGQLLWQNEQPRPLHHLAFVPEAPCLLAAADFGLAVCFDANTGKQIWREGLPAHCGALAVNGDGQRGVLACYSDGLRRCTCSNGAKDHITTREPCRLAAMSFDGRRILVAGRTNRLLLLDQRGKVLGIHLLESPAVALALSALGDRAVVALSADGVRALDLRRK